VDAVNVRGIGAMRRDKASLSMPEGKARLEREDRFRARWKRPVRPGECRPQARLGLSVRR